MGDAHSLHNNTEKRSFKRTGGGHATGRSLKSVIIEEENGLRAISLSI